LFSFSIIKLKLNFVFVCCKSSLLFYFKHIINQSIYYPVAIYWILHFWNRSCNNIVPKVIQHSQTYFFVFIKVNKRSPINTFFILYNYLNDVVDVWAVKNQLSKLNIKRRKVKQTCLNYWFKHWTWVFVDLVKVAHHNACILVWIQQIF